MVFLGEKSLKFFEITIILLNTEVLCILFDYQFHSVAQSCPTPWTAARLASLSITNSWSLLKLISIKLVMPSNHLILCHPILFLPSVFPSIRVFSSESVLHIRWPKYWSFSIRPSNEYSGLISIRIDWFDLLAVMILVDRCCLISFQKCCTSGYSPQ